MNYFVFLELFLVSNGDYMHWQSSPGEMAVLMPSVPVRGIGKLFSKGLSIHADEFL